LKVLPKLQCFYCGKELQETIPRSSYYKKRDLWKFIVIIVLIVCVSSIAVGYYHSEYFKAPLVEPTVETIPTLTQPSTTTPNPDSYITDRCPKISVSTTDLNINTSSITMTINGTSVTPTYNPATGLISYTPTEDLAYGTHQVCIWVEDLSHNSDSASWSFTVYGAWNVDLVLNCDVAAVNDVTFGISPDATAGYDGSPYDKAAPPPPPIYEYTDFYFYYTGNVGQKKLLVSTINTNDTLEWPLTVRILKDGPWSGDVTITWNTADMANVPPIYTLTLTRGATTVDMRTTSYYTFTADIGAGENLKSYEFTINADLTV
jgi:hypothetical protein